MDVPGPKKPVDRSLEVTRYNSDDQVVEKRFMNQDELEAIARRNGSMSILQIKFEIPAGGRAEVVRKTLSLELEDYGEIALLVGRQALGLQASVRFPGKSWGGLPKPDVDFVHQDGADASVCQYHPDPENGVLTAEIKGALLPFNGMIITWRREP